MVFRQFHIKEPCKKAKMWGENAALECPWQITLSKKLKHWKTSEFYFLITCHGHHMLRKMQRQLSKPLTPLGEKYQKLHLSIEKMYMSLVLLQSPATHQPDRCSTKGDLRVIENVKQRPVALILGPNSLTYNKKFVTFCILPLPLYQEFHVILLPAKKMNGEIDINRTKCISRLD